MFLQKEIINGLMEKCDILNLFIQWGGVSFSESHPIPFKSILKTHTRDIFTKMIDYIQF